MATCPACTSNIPEGATVCPVCGFALTTSLAPNTSAPSSAPTRPASPRAPMPPRGPVSPTMSGLQGASVPAMTGPAMPGAFGYQPSMPSMPGPSLPGNGVPGMMVAQAPQTNSYGQPPPPQPAPQGPPPAQGDADPYINRTLAGKFLISELLGQGGMGKVYKARHLGLDKIVCIKTLKPALLEDATVVGRFQREAKAASRLNHGNSIQVLDFGQDEFGTLYIVMEYVSGKDLRKTLRDEFPLGEERICHIVGQVLSALAEAHAGNVIHRDLKPENIMLEQRRGEPDYVKVLDFGIAKIQDPEVPGLTRADVVCGTPLYMSPEQATGSKFDARADLYAMGIILYQLTTGQLPFDGANSMEILTKHVTELPIPPRIRRPEVNISPEMEALILRAMDKDPAKRPQSAEEFRSDLLKIKNKLARAREDADESARKAQTAHKEQRAEELKAKQAAQIAQFTGNKEDPKPAPELDRASDTGMIQAAALPKSKAPMFAAIGVGVLVLAGGAFMATRPKTGESTGSSLAASPGAVSPPATPATAVAAPAAPAAPVTAPPVEPPAAAPVAAAPVAAAPVAAAPVAAAPVAAAPVAAAPVAAAPVAAAPAADAVAKPPAEPPLPHGDTAKARDITEEADLLLEEEDFEKALSKYKEAISADPSFAKAYKGIIRAGTGAGNMSAVKVGLKGYLRASPDAPDASMFRKQLASMR